MNAQAYAVQVMDAAELREDLAWYYSRDNLMSLERARAEVDAMTDSQVWHEWERLAHEGVMV